ncbi:hypothetical protein NDU88_005829 [Pleurodeles waltl]|uniref:Uncharacterized protein n=1 Tax=Pleurodeles waltl TaxID=8319 RepID=A0AAV7LQM8_PLEWA|nr:hypothetical protein NDU88_005829 [Pleurodeles waltl]
MGRGGMADRGTARRSLQQDWGVAARMGRPREREASGGKQVLCLHLSTLGDPVRQLLSAARVHGPFKLDVYEIRITADFSEETNERRKGFLAI